MADGAAAGAKAGLECGRTARASQPAAAAAMRKLHATQRRAGSQRRCFQRHKRDRARFGCQVQDSLEEDTRLSRVTRETGASQVTRETGARCCTRKAVPALSRTTFLLWATAVNGG